AVREAYEARSARIATTGPRPLTRADSPPPPSGKHVSFWQGRRSARPEQRGDRRRHGLDLVSEAAASYWNGSSWHTSRDVAHELARSVPSRRLSPRASFASGRTGTRAGRAGETEEARSL